MATASRKASVAELVDRLKSKNEAVQEETVQELIAAGERAVPELLKAMSARAYQVRSCSARALGEIGDARAVEPLVQALGDTSVNVQRSASEALAKLGSCATEALMLCLDSTDSLARKWAAEALGKIGDD